MSYKPLPDCLTIKQSPIDGLGLFATEDIPYGYRSNPDIPGQMILPTHFGPTHVEITYYYEGKEETIEFIRTPLGGFINHSIDPNLHLLQYDNTYPNYKMYYVSLRRDIKSGEELTLDYSKSLCGLTGYKNEEWMK